jgi:hypothetical protein
VIKKKINLLGIPVTIFSTKNQQIGNPKNPAHSRLTPKEKSLQIIDSQGFLVHSSVRHRGKNPVASLFLSETIIGSVFATHSFDSRYQGDLTTYGQTTTT